jgi:hypothetical protein
MLTMKTVSSSSRIVCLNTNHQAMRLLARRCMPLWLAAALRRFLRDLVDAFERCPQRTGPERAMAPVASASLLDRSSAAFLAIGYHLSSAACAKALAPAKMAWRSIAVRASVRTNSKPR